MDKLKVNNYLPENAETVSSRRQSLPLEPLGIISIAIYSVFRVLRLTAGSQYESKVLNFTVNRQIHYHWSYLSSATTNSNNSDNKNDKISDILLNKHRKIRLADASSCLGYFSKLTAQHTIYFRTVTCV